MHFFGVLGTLMFFIGFVAVIIVGATNHMICIMAIRTDWQIESPYFYISLTMMILGTMLFLGGFFGRTHLTKFSRKKSLPDRGRIF